MSNLFPAFDYIAIRSTGFSTVIPGFPRYSVMGDRRHGVYNLRVSNASLEDDAEFQCQVGPSRMNKAIRANARLSVICKYTSSHPLSNNHRKMMAFLSTAFFFRAINDEN